MFRKLLKKNQPIIMGVLNVTPDSFSDGGDFLDPQKALQKAQEMLEHGADIIDIGAESSAPNSKEVSEQEEWKRLENILPTLQEANIPFSIDTYKSSIARKALKFGATMVNDVTALRRDSQMAEVLSEFPKSFICLMYSKDASTRTTFENSKKTNIIQTISDFFVERIYFAKKKRISENRIVLDPGMGAFLSSDPSKSFEVLRNLDKFQKFDCPLLVGTSRKSFLREISDTNNPQNRTIASITSSLVALQNGAQIVRVHDVQQMKEAIETWQAII